MFSVANLSHYALLCQWDVIILNTLFNCEAKSPSSKTAISERGGVGRGSFTVVAFSSSLKRWIFCHTIYEKSFTRSIICMEYG